MKRTKRNIARWREDCRLYNKRMKQQGRHDEILTFEEYVSYIHGKSKFVATHRQNNLPDYPEYPNNIPSHMSTVGSTEKKPVQKYTGDKIKGTVIMHKSNIVPYTEDSQVKEVARMRR